MDPWTHLGSELLEVMSWVGPLILLGCFDSLLRVCAKVSSYHRILPPYTATPLVRTCTLRDSVHAAGHLGISTISMDSSIVG